MNMKHLLRLFLTFFVMSAIVPCFAYDALIDGICYNLYSSTHTAKVTSETRKNFDLYG